MTRRQVLDLIECCKFEHGFGYVDILDALEVICAELQVNLLISIGCLCLELQNKVFELAPRVKKFSCLKHLVAEEFCRLLLFFTIPG